ncbi:MAG: hypothetical protein LBK58_04065 [Prevotellaceae bacterium]|jgi:hypothetical protein|nr:hypothetical protein [Prevotellaceae bacterium]
METVTAKQIHEAFDLESDGLLVMPEDNFPKKEVIKEKAERLKKLGFSRCSEVGQLERFDEDRESYLRSLEEQRTAHEFAQKYRAKYPGLKFIVKKQLDEICLKYSLVAKPVSEYVGGVPEQKLFEIEYWLDEIEDVDMPDDTLVYELRVRDKNTGIEIERIREWAERSGRTHGIGALVADYHLKPFLHKHEGKTPPSELELMVFFEAKGVPQRDILMSNIKMHQVSNSGLMIAAPESMFRKIQKNLDPIVLQPVNGGYLVVAKWGDEANDPELVVPELN